MPLCKFFYIKKYPIPVVIHSMLPLICVIYGIVCPRIRNIIHSPSYPYNPYSFHFLSLSLHLSTIMILPDIDKHITDTKYLVLPVDNVDKYVDILLIGCGLQEPKSLRDLSQSFRSLSQGPPDSHSGIPTEFMRLITIKP